MYNSLILFQFGSFGKGQQCEDPSNLIQVVLYKSSPTFEIILGDGLIDEHSRT